MAIVKMMITLCLSAWAGIVWADSTNLAPPRHFVAQSKRAYVDTNNCTSPIKSSPYIMVGGTGGANMQLTCPADHPVMYSWQQRVIFGAMTGGGRSWVTCCALNHRWVSVVKA